MPIKFKLIARKNPRDLQAPEKYYAAAIRTGKDDIYSLAEEIYPHTTMGKSDIIGVLTALGELIPKRLKLGRSIDLMDLCIFSPAVSSEGVETIEEFNSIKHIEKIRVNVQAKKSLKEIVKTFPVERIA